MRQLKLILGLLLLGVGQVSAQATMTFTRADSLRGALRPERTCYDVYFYDLEVKVDPATRKISGKNTIHFTTIQNFRTLQVDLFANMNVDGISYEGKSLKYRREHDAIFVEFPEEVRAPAQGALTIAYSGTPIVAARPPWDGGFVWKKDEAGKPWVGVACEGTGASLWWPNKDHLSDEPDSMAISVIAPNGLKAIANGTLRGVKDLDTNWAKWDWFVHYPINNYNVTVNIADYVHIHDTFTNASGTHDLDYYVLKANEAKARAQFVQVKPMLKCFEQYFGEYPFWKDGYALVETPYLGMEHQGAIAYGNHYRKGYDGFDPLNLGFDYIVIHESGHEWWGNSVSCSDHAELWIHESFCTYSEAVYVEHLWDEPTAIRYLMNQRSNIMNRTPIVGPLDVNFNHWAGSDMYYKGAWMLHTLRHQVNDDALWWKTIYDFAETFKRKNTNTQEVIAWFNEALGKDYTWLFQQYLYEAKAPILRIKRKGKGDKTQLKARWDTDTKGFRLSVRIPLGDGSFQTITPTSEWQKFTINVPVDRCKIDPTVWYGKVIDDAKK